MYAMTTMHAISNLWSLLFILSCMYVNHLRLSAGILKLLLTYLLAKGWLSMLLEAAVHTPYPWFKILEEKER